MNTLATPRPIARPWYREPWPWIIMAIPGAAVIMGVVMIVLAARTNDGLVVEDYYKQGLAINQVLDREARARALGIAAVVTVSGDHSRVYVRFAAPENAVQAPALSFVHPTRAGRDHRVVLNRTLAGEYEGEMLPLSQGHWRVVIDDRNAGWRLQGAWHTGNMPLELAPIP
jgi:hypothetical protein